MKLEVNLPCVAPFGDYHDIDQVAYGQPFIKGLRGKEVAFDGQYWGVFYIGEMPCKEDVNAMLQKAGFDFASNRAAA